MKASKIYIHRYEMRSRLGLNSRSDQTLHRGALIMVERDCVPGYGCLHPWESLGDVSLDGLIQQLVEGRISRQVRSALECAEVDREARLSGVSLFDGLEVPDSHATIVGGLDRVGEAVAEGYDTVKLKMGRDDEANLKLLKSVFDAFPALRVRLDYNGVSGVSAMDHFLGAMGEDLRRQIDFIEDPFSYEDAAWGELRDKYAVKFGVDRGVGEATVEYDVAVVKPAINDVDKICNRSQMCGRNVVITSYMDHPVGQSYAAYCAGKMNGMYVGLVNKRCGLMTHGLFESTGFIEKLSGSGPAWNYGVGEVGLGFDELLGGLDWQDIKRV